MTMSDIWEEIEREQLHFAAQDGDLDRVSELLALRHDVNHFDTMGNTPLHRAVESGHGHIVDRLLEAGADVNAHNDDVIGNTPLCNGAETCSYEMAKRLIDAGADPTIRGWMGMNAIDHAVERKDPDAEKVLKLLQDAAKRFPDVKTA